MKTLSIFNDDLDKLPGMGGWGARACPEWVTRRGGGERCATRAQVVPVLLHVLPTTAVSLGRGGVLDEVLIQKSSYYGGP